MQDYPDDPTSAPTDAPSTSGDEQQEGETTLVPKSVFKEPLKVGDPLPPMKVVSILEDEYEIGPADSKQEETSESDTSAPEDMGSKIDALASDNAS